MKFSILGIVLSFICITIAIKINYEMSIEYSKIQGKSRAFFELRHLNRYYYGFFGIIGLVFAFIALKLNENKWLVFGALFLALAGSIITFSKVWEWML